MEELCAFVRRSFHSAWHVKKKNEINLAKIIAIKARVFGAAALTGSLAHKFKCDGPRVAAWFRVAERSIHTI